MSAHEFIRSCVAQGLCAYATPPPRAPRGSSAPGLRRYVIHTPESRAAQSQRQREAWVRRRAARAKALAN